jgi:hypothetical protein
MRTVPIFVPETGYPRLAARQLVAGKSIEMNYLMGK